MIPADSACKDEDQGCQLTSWLQSQGTSLKALNGGRPESWVCLIEAINGDLTALLNQVVAKLQVTFRHQRAVLNSDAGEVRACLSTEHEMHSWVLESAQTHCHPRCIRCYLRGSCLIWLSIKGSGWSQYGGNQWSHLSLIHSDHQLSPAWEERWSAQEEGLWRQPEGAWHEIPGESSWRSGAWASRRFQPSAESCTGLGSCHLAWGTASWSWCYGGQERPLNSPHRWHLCGGDSHW